jgi:subtilisin family serine protease
MSKKALLALAFPISISAAFGAVQVIPKAKQDLKAIAEIQSLVLKNAKGTLFQKSFMNVAPENWFNLSPAEGSEGVVTEETYVTFPQPAGADIIVAVIDSGVDVNHEDLQGKIWTNKNEIPENGIDDDKNGYVDDVFG